MIREHHASGSRANVMYPKWRVRIPREAGKLYLLDYTLDGSYTSETVRGTPQECIYTFLCGGPVSVLR